jgi:hypothetical protein
MTKESEMINQRPECVGCPCYEDVGGDDMARWACTPRSAEELDAVCQLEIKEDENVGESEQLPLRV